MKEPMSPLPFKEYYGTIINKENWDLIDGNYDTSTQTTEVQFRCQEDLEYIVQACNNFPKAIELLRELVPLLRKASFNRNQEVLEDKAMKIEDFLKEIDV